MLRAEILINLEGAAFWDKDGAHDPCPEVARILRELAKRVDKGATAWTLRDVNGNECGDLHIDVHVPNEEG